MKGGVYIYRARKPAARLRIPLVSTHWAYVGETNNFLIRHGQHMGQPVAHARYAGAAKPWADLVVSVHRIPLPAWKPLLRTAETLLIMLTWPVYNVAKNRWNPRRIKPWTAVVHRDRRDMGKHSTFPIWPGVLAVAIVLTAIVLRIRGL